MVGEIVRTLTHRNQDPRLHFWRTSAGSEVDLLVEYADRLIPLEAKASATPRAAQAAALTALRRDLGGPVVRGYLVHAGSTALPLGRDATALPFDDL
jgi:hypothetical protein